MGTTRVCCRGTRPSGNRGTQKTHGNQRELLIPEIRGGAMGRKPGCRRERDFRRGAQRDEIPLSPQDPTGGRHQPHRRGRGFLGWLHDHDGLRSGRGSGEGGNGALRLRFFRSGKPKRTGCRRSETSENKPCQTVTRGTSTLAGMPGCRAPRTAHEGGLLPRRRFQ